MQRVPDSSAIRQEVRTHTKSRRWGPKAGRTTGKNRLLARNHSGYATERDTQGGGQSNQGDRDATPTQRRAIGRNFRSQETAEPSRDRSRKPTVEQGSQTNEEALVACTWTFRDTVRQETDYGNKGQCVGVTTCGEGQSTRRSTLAYGKRTVQQGYGEHGRPRRIAMAWLRWCAKAKLQGCCACLVGNSSGKSGGKQGTAHVPTQAGVL